MGNPEVVLGDNLEVIAEEEIVILRSRTDVRKHQLYDGSQRAKGPLRIKQNPFLTSWIDPPREFSNGSSA